MTNYKVTFKGDFFDITLEGGSGKEVVTEFLRAKEEIENALRSQDLSKSTKAPPLWAPKPMAPQHVIPKPLEELFLQDLSIPGQVKDAFVERKDEFSNWDTIFLLLHYSRLGLTNKRLRSLSEELGKFIKFSWFDSEFHRRDNEGLVMSKRVPGQREVVYFLTEPGKKQAEGLLRTLESASPQGAGDRQR